MKKVLESNENSFKQIFRRFKEDYMYYGLQDLPNKQGIDVAKTAMNFSAINNNDERAKNVERDVFKNHPVRKIKAFLYAIDNVFGRVNNIDTSLALSDKEAQEALNNERKTTDQSKQMQAHEQQENDIDDDF